MYLRYLPAPVGKRTRALSAYVPDTGNFDPIYKGPNLPLTATIPVSASVPGKGLGRLGRAPGLRAYIHSGFPLPTVSQWKGGFLVVNGCSRPNVNQVMAAQRPRKKKVSCGACSVRSRRTRRPSALGSLRDDSSSYDISMYTGLDTNSITNFPDPTALPPAPEPVDTNPYATAIINQPYYQAGPAAIDMQTGKYITAPTTEGWMQQLASAAGQIGTAGVQSAFAKASGQPQSPFGPLGSIGGIPSSYLLWGAGGLVAVLIVSKLANG